MTRPHSECLWDDRDPGIGVQWDDWDPRDWGQKGWLGKEENIVNQGNEDRIGSWGWGKGSSARRMEGS